MEKTKFKIDHLSDWSQPTQAANTAAHTDANAIYGLSKKLVELQEQVFRLTSELEAKDKAYNQIKDRQEENNVLWKRSEESLKLQHHALEQTAQALKNEKEEITQKLSSEQTRLEAVSQNRQRLESEVNDLTRQISVLRGREEALQQANDSKTTQVQEQALQLVALKDHSKELLREQQNLKSRLSELTILTDKQSYELKEFQDLKKDSRRLYAELGSARTQAKHLAINLQDAAAKCIRLEEQNEAQRKVLKKAEEAIQELQYFKQKSHDIENSKSMLDQQVQTLQAEFKKQESKLAEAEKLKESLYVSIIEQIEKRLTSEERRNLILSATARSSRPSQHSEVAEDLDVIRDWMLRIAK